MAEKAEQYIVSLPDPRLPNDQLAVVIREGGSAVSYQQIQAPNGSSVSPVFTLLPPSNTGVSKRIRLRVKGSVTFTGTPSGSPAVGMEAYLANSSIAFRQFPLQSCMSQCNAMVNNTQLTIPNPAISLPLLVSAGFDSHDMAGAASSSCTAPDIVCSYNDQVLRVGGPFDSEVDGPYSDYSSAGRTSGWTSIFLPAGGTAGAGATTLTANFELFETLVLSPLNYTRSESEILMGINNMTISISYNAALWNRMFSYQTLAAPVITAVAVTLSEQSLEVVYVSPKMDYLERPLRYAYNCARLVTYVTSTQSMGALPFSAAGAPVSLQANSSTVSSQTVELPVVPSRFIIAAMISQNTTAAVATSFPNVVLAPLQLTVTAFGKTVLSGATTRQLYDLSVAAGLNCSYPRFAGLPVIRTNSSSFAGGTAAVTSKAAFAGAPIILDVADCLALPDGVVPGMGQRCQFIFQLTFANQTQFDLTAAGSVSLLVISVTDGHLQIYDGASQYTDQIISADEVFEAPRASAEETMVLQKMAHTGITGGALRSVTQKESSPAGRASMAKAPTKAPKSLLGGRLMAR